MIFTFLFSLIPFFVSVNELILGLRDFRFISRLVGDCQLFLCLCRFFILFLLNFFEPRIDTFSDCLLAIGVVSDVTQVKLVLVAEHDRKQYLTVNSVWFAW